MHWKLPELLDFSDRIITSTAILERDPSTLSSSMVRLSLDLEISSKDAEDIMKMIEEAVTKNNDSTLSSRIPVNSKLNLGRGCYAASPPPIQSFATNLETGVDYSLEYRSTNMVAKFSGILQSAGTVLDPEMQFKNSATLKSGFAGEYFVSS